VANTRRGFFTDSDIERLLPHLPEYLRPIDESAYITGWRRGELCSLRWSQVDWETGTMRLERGATKSGEPRSFPFIAHPRLNALLRERLRRAKEWERENKAICP
jgi:integrase